MFLRTGKSIGLGDTVPCDPVNDPTCLANLGPGSFGTPVGSTSAGTVATDTGATANIDSQLNLYSWLNSIIPQSNGTNKPVSSNASWAFSALVGLLGILALAQIAGGRRR